MLESHHGGAVTAFPTLAGTPPPHERVLAQRLPHGITHGSRAVAMDDRHAAGIGPSSVVQVAIEHVQGLFHPSPTQVEA